LDDKKTKEMKKKKKEKKEEKKRNLNHIYTLFQTTSNMYVCV